MNSRLPDVALTERPIALAPLDWVGMQGIDVPVLLDEPGIAHPVHARADVRVDLPNRQVKGIHMSRLYRLVDGFAQAQTVRPASLAALLENMVRSHADCDSTRAALTLSFELLTRRAALVTQGLSGWKSYPARLEAVWDAGRFQLTASVAVAYSSTCPCSAALSRQLVEDAFVSRFGVDAPVDPSAVAAWLRDNATLATPHSQRSRVEVAVLLAGNAPSLGLLDLIGRIEEALGTPVQTAVKRADEQAFARLNGRNLMYVEDAARKVQQAVAGSYDASSVSVRHFESLHPHDAIASTSSRGPNSIRSGSRPPSSPWPASTAARTCRNT